MATTYRITLLGSSIDNSEAPPSIVKAIFPAFAGEPCITDRQFVEVTFPSPQTPVDLGPLVKVEVVA